MADILLGNVKGPQGNTGATGSQGPHGDAATITVGTVSTTAYGNTASVTNSGTEQDAVLDFVIPQGKPGEQTTRMGALTLDTITAQSADFPIPAVGETGSTVFGKIIKFFNSTISALNSKLNISDVVNNLTSTSTTQPLSAAQGKALNDALSSPTTQTVQWNAILGTDRNKKSLNVNSYKYMKLRATFPNGGYGETVVDCRYYHTGFFGNVFIHNGYPDSSNFYGMMTVLVESTGLTIASEQHGTGITGDVTLSVTTYA